MLALAQATAERLNVQARVTLVQSTVDDLPPGRRFDAATCLFVLHFLPDAAKRTLEHVAEHDAELGSVASRLAEVGFLLNDIATELASYQAGLDTEGPERLAEIEDRRAVLAKLVRKYAPTIDEVLVWAENARVRFDELQDDSTRIEKSSGQSVGQRKANKTAKVRRSFLAVNGGSPASGARRL